MQVKFKLFFLETRPQFLILAVVLAFLGICIAWYDGYLHLGHAALAFAGLLLAHASCNTLNDYFDYKSGIDLVTERTPFSGGSGMLKQGLLTPKQVYLFSIVCFLLCIPIGIYFVIVSGWMLLPLLIIGAICILFYSPVILKLNWPEWSPFLGLGVLPVLGTYFVQTSAYTLPAIIASIPSGILVHNLLFLNEFPDAEADTIGSRKTLPITLGKKKAGVFYAVLEILVYVWIIGAVMAGIMPAFSLIALLTIPLAIKAIQGALNPDDLSRFMPAMASNVMVVLLTQLLLGIGYILAIVTK
jgi:1,4-dihydroxy-2-naphthoate octaprenyltransferase